jgi:hypothetical protein
MPANGWDVIEMIHHSHIGMHNTAAGEAILGAAMRLSAYAVVISRHAITARELTAQGLRLLPSSMSS